MRALIKGVFMEKIYDIAVVGGGPAGLTAALYGLRNGKEVVIIEKSVFGGQIVNSPNVENIPGFISISGDEYGDLLLKQVQAQGGQAMFDEVLKIESDTYKNSGAYPATISDSSLLKVGNNAIAIGNPEDEGISVTVDPPAACWLR